jgi:hypothetical protein
MSIERGPTQRTEEWKAKLRAATDGYGKRMELARFLSDGDEGSVQSRKVQIIRVLDHGTMPEPEFVLATLEWLDRQSLRKVPKAKPRRTRKPATLK